MVKYGELNQALMRYTIGDIREDIPVDYYRRVIKAWLRVTNNGMNWDVQQAASILLYLAYHEGCLQPSQLNLDGLRSLDWAERFLDQANIMANHEVVRALSTAKVSNFK